MNILALDPGITVGYARFTKGCLIEFGHLLTVEEVVDYICRWKTNTPMVPYTIVYEAFARGNSAIKEQITTIEMCGVIQAMACIANTPLVKQYPSARVGYIPIAKCMVKTLWSTLKEYQHAVDAIAHGLVYLDTCGIQWERTYWVRKTFNTLNEKE